MTKTICRLYVDEPLAGQTAITLAGAPHHYLRNVLRAKAGAHLHIFNGYEGEYLAAILEPGKKQILLEIKQQTRAHSHPPDLWLLFAPLKKERMDYFIQKATEMGVAKLCPIITRFTQQSAGGIKPDKFRKNAIEAAEQCGLLSIPDIAPPLALTDILRDWPAERQLIYADEQSLIGEGQATLHKFKNHPLAFLVGPEGGLHEDERQLLQDHPASHRVNLGPRILRADTAMVAGLSLLQFHAGDWQNKD